MPPACPRPPPQPASPSPSPRRPCGPPAGRLCPAAASLLPLSFPLAFPVFSMFLCSVTRATPAPGGFSQRRAAAPLGRASGEPNKPAPVRRGSALLAPLSSFSRLLVPVSPPLPGEMEGEISPERPGPGTKPLCDPGCCRPRPPARPSPSPVFVWWRLSSRARRAGSAPAAGAPAPPGRVRVAGAGSPLPGGGRGRAAAPGDKMAPRREPDRSVMRTRDRRSWGDGLARGAVSRLGQRLLAGERQPGRDSGAPRLTRRWGRPEPGS